jgi:hypothetical protein
LPNGQTVEQIHLRQFAVRQFVEKGFCRSLTTRSLRGTSMTPGLNDHGGYGLVIRDGHWRQIQLTLSAKQDHDGLTSHCGSMACRRKRLFALAQSLLAQGHVFFNLALFMP